MVCQIKLHTNAVPDGLVCQRLKHRNQASEHLQNSVGIDRLLQTAQATCPDESCGRWLTYCVHYQADAISRCNDMPQQSHKQAGHDFNLMQSAG